MLGDNIEIMVIDIKGDQIKLGINAPDSVKIYRKEVYFEIKKQNIEATTTVIKDINALSSILKKADKDKKE